MKAGYLGPYGSYSELAAEKLCPNDERIAFSSFPLLFAALKKGTVDGIVIPIENSLNGGVLQNIDLMQDTEGVCAVKAVTVKVEHRLALKDGVNERDIKYIYSHPQALEQCSKYLAKNFPDAEPVPVLSTAASLEKLGDMQSAGIVGAHVRCEGVTLLKRSIADSNNNRTLFLLVKRGEVPENVRTKKLYFSVTCYNVSGGLLSILQRVAKHGLNMNKIESRPVKDMPSTFRFFIETDGDYSEPRIKAALKDIQDFSLSFKLLGAY